MTQIKNYNYSEKEISMMVVDSNGYAWLGFNQDSSGNCAFQKVSGNNPLQKYYDIDIATTKIKCGTILDDYIYIGLNDDDLIGKRYGLLNPLTITNDFTLPVGITEAPVAVIANGNYVYFLIPGLTSGTNAKICIFTLAGVYQETIDLATVTNASSFTIDTDNTELWVVTNQIAITYTRVYQISGDVWTYTVNS